MSSRRKGYTDDPGESSKQCKKKARQQEMAAMAAATEDKRLCQGLRIEVEVGKEGESNSSQSSGVDDDPKGKKKMGSTSQLKLEGKRKDLTFNDRSDLVGDSDKFASFLGSLVREHVPATYNDWQKVSLNMKDDMWKIIMLRWNVKGDDRRHAMGKMGKMWRDSKSRLTKNIRKFHENHENEADTNEDDDINSSNKDVMDELRALRQRVGEMDELREQLKELQAAVKAVAAQRMQAHQVQSQSRSVNDMMPSSDSINQMQQSGTGLQGGQNLENAKCKLLNWGAAYELVVAEGEIASTDPKSLVDDVPVGRDCYKVRVNKVIITRLRLFRVTREMLSLDEACGSTIAWPINCIQIDG